MLYEIADMKLIFEMQMSYLYAGSTVATHHVKKSLLVENQAIEAGVSGGGYFAASIHLCFVITFLVFC